MDHGRTYSMSGTEERMPHGRTKDPRPPEDRNPAARANPNLSLTRHTNNGHQDQRPPDIDKNNGHYIYIHIASDEDSDK
jgi:hypothetical protein